MELDLPSSPLPVEDLLAARRAKRQAILAKYAGVASVSTSISPSPGPSSAVQPPTPSLSVSNPVSQTLLLSDHPAPIENDQIDEAPSQYFILFYFKFLFLLIHFALTRST